MPADRLFAPFFRSAFSKGALNDQNGSKFGEVFFFTTQFHTDSEFKRTDLMQVTGSALVNFLGQTDIFPGCKEPVKNQRDY